MDVRCVMMTMLFLFISLVSGATGAVIELSDDGIWCWFGDPRGVYINNKFERTYFGWITKNGSIQAGGIDHTTNTALPIITLYDRLEANDHDSPQLLKMKDKRLMIFYSKHNGKEIFYHTTVNPEDISSWSPAARLRDGATFTYPSPFRLPKDGNKIYLFARNIDWQPCLSVSSDDGKTWSKFVKVIQGGERPYMKARSDGRSTIHVAFTDGHPRNEEQNKVYYAFLRNGWWHRANGQRIKHFKTAPLEGWEADVAYDASAGRGWVWDIGIDTHAKPVVVHTAMPEETEHKYHYARWDGARWQNNFIMLSGKWFYGGDGSHIGNPPRQTHYSGGLVLDARNPKVVYLSRSVGRRFRIERWETGDEGLNWTGRVVASHPDKSLVRPFTVPGPDGKTGLSYVQINKYGHYKTYDASLQYMMVHDS